jgi:ribonuclease HI
MVYLALFRLSDNASVYEAELFGLWESLKWIKRNRGSGAETHIYSDSLSSLNSLRTRSSTIHPWVVEIRRLFWELERRNVATAFHWVKAYAGFLGNEDADSLAKEAARRDITVSKTKISWTEAKRKMHRAAWQAWQEKWTGSTKGRWTFGLYTPPWTPKGVSRTSC